MQAIATTKTTTATSTTEGVVSNDSFNLANAKVTTESNTTVTPPKTTAEVLLVELIAEKDVWFTNAYRTSNEQLYALLAKCYDFYFQMKSADENGKKLRDGFDNYIKAKNYSFSAGSHTLVKIVKCVFGADRRRVSAYGIVLRSALQKNLTPDQVAEFIRENGGIEEVRLMKAPNAMSAKQKAVAGADTLPNKTIVNVSATVFKEKLDAGNIGKPVVLIGTWNADGTISVHSFTNSGGAVNAALISHYAQSKTQADTVKADTQAANDSAIEKDAVALAVAQAQVMPLAA